MEINLARNYPGTSATFPATLFPFRKIFTLTRESFAGLKRRSWDDDGPAASMQQDSKAKPGRFSLQCFTLPSGSLLLFGLEY
jgi:hypothetical protein